MDTTGGLKLCQERECLDYLERYEDEHSHRPRCDAEVPGSVMGDLRCELVRGHEWGHKVKGPNATTYTWGAPARLRPKEGAI